MIWRGEKELAYRRVYESAAKKMWIPMIWVGRRRLIGQGESDLTWEVAQANVKDGRHVPGDSGVQVTKIYIPFNGLNHLSIKLVVLNPWIDTPLGGWVTYQTFTLHS